MTVDGAAAGGDAFARQNVEGDAVSVVPVTVWSAWARDLTLLLVVVATFCVSIAGPPPAIAVVGVAGTVAFALWHVMVRLS